MISIRRTKVAVAFAITPCSVLVQNWARPFSRLLLKVARLSTTTHEQQHEEGISRPITHAGLGHGINTEGGSSSSSILNESAYQVGESTFACPRSIFKLNDP